MTTATVADVTRVRRPRARPTLVGSMLERFRAELEASSRIVWPDPRWQQDPIGFVHEVLGQGTWAKQDEILLAARDHDRVSVVSGHKVSKSNTAACVALWFYCTFPEGRVVMSSVTARQVDEILWREVRKLRSRAGRCLACKAAEELRSKADRAKAPSPMPCPHSSTVDGKMNEQARTGLRAPDYLRQIVGFTAREAEAVAGVSGENLLYILDEASGIPQPIFEAIEGNRAGGARILLFSNPTRTEGEFFESQTSKALKTDKRGRTTGFYKTVHVSSEDTPNVRERRKVIPGLATYEWVEEKKREWGVDSALYKVRVQGQFVLNEEGKILSLHELLQAELRWPATAADGRLFVGIDPSGPGDAGDDSVFAARRGQKVVELHVPTTGLSAEQHVTEALSVIAKHRVDREVAPPVLVIDRDGPIGAEIYGLLRAYEDLHAGELVVVGVRGSDRAYRDRQLYDRVRDEVWANLAAWLKAGGALPEDTRLAKELHAPSWFQPLGSAKLKATSKKDLRKMLDGRSPDRADAVALSVWETASIAVRPSSGQAPAPDAYRVVEAIDPYVIDGLGESADPVYG